ncbi:unnamed protein product, partial [Prorocentrum cordatum]
MPQGARGPAAAAPPAVGRAHAAVALRPAAGALSSGGVLCCGVSARLGAARLAPAPSRGRASVVGDGPVAPAAGLLRAPGPRAAPARPWATSGSAGRLGRPSAAGPRRGRLHGRRRRGAAAGAGRSAGAGGPRARQRRRG